MTTHTVELRLPSGACFRRSPFMPLAQAEELAKRYAGAETFTAVVVEAGKYQEAAKRAGEVLRHSGAGRHFTFGT